MTYAGRTRRTIEGTTIEASIDRGVIRSGEHVNRVSELELELKAGDSRQLYELALRLQHDVPLALESRSKAARGYALNFRACSGARIADVTNTQLGALSAGTAYVTISVGGNDAGFADVITECALPWWAADCDGAIDGAQAFINNQLPGQLSTLYAAIRTRAPAAQVVVVGYPRLFMGVDCNAGTWFSPNPGGSGGVPATGESESARRISYGMPDVLGEARQRYAGKRIAVLGGGHSAIGSLIALIVVGLTITVNPAIRAANFADPWGDIADTNSFAAMLALIPAGGTIVALMVVGGALVGASP